MSDLRESVLAAARALGWSLDWRERGAYLHLEASELIEAVRGKAGDPREEAADVLITLLAVSPLGLDDLVAVAQAKLDRMAPGAAGASNPPLLAVTLPGHLTSWSNSRGSWQARHRWAQRWRMPAKAMARGALVSGVLSALERGQLEVTLVRVAARALDDDNLRGALKAVRDGVADALGIDDRDPRVTWSYRQDRGPSGAIIEMRRRA